MKVLMISTDEKVFLANSPTRARILEYTALAEELHLIVKTKSSELKNQRVGQLFLYPTNSRSGYCFVHDAMKIGKTILRQSGQWLITTQDPFLTGWAGWRLKKKFGVPLQIQIHTDFLSPYFGRSLSNKVRQILAKLVLPKADGIRVVSSRIKDSVISQFPNFPISKISILPIFTDIKKIQSAEIKIDLHQKYPQFDFIILMASRLTEEKNIPLALEAFGQVLKNHPKAGLIIVGNGPEQESLKFKVKSLKLSENVVFEPWTGELASFYKTADLFLLTSNFEGWSLAVVEAMAAGCPVVMTDVGCAGELAINNESALVTPVGDIEAIAEGVAQLIDNEVLQGKIKAGGLQAVQNLTTKEQYLADYKKSWEACL